MKLKEIDPFVRFTSIGNAIPHNDLMTYDCRFYYCMQGKMTIRAKGVDYVLTEGCALMFPSGTEYSFSNIKDTRIVFINFDYTMENSAHKDALIATKSTEFLQEKCFCAPHFDDATALNSVLYGKNAFEIENNLKQIYRLSSSMPLFWEEEVSSLFRAVIVYLARMSGAGSETNLAERVEAYIRENFYAPLTNDAIGKKFGYNSLYLNRLMKQQTGITLRGLLLSVRLRNAQKLLLATELPVAEIAVACGFGSSSAFIEFFRERMGKTPSRFRKDARV